MLDKDIIEFIESMADFGGILTISNEFLSFDLNKFKHKWIFEISQ